MAGRNIYRSRGPGAFVLPYSSVGPVYFGFTPLPAAVVALVVAILVAYFLSAEAAKRPFFRRFEL